MADVKAPERRRKNLPFVKCDVSKEPQVRACVRAVIRRFGRLDGLVNNAGLANPHTGAVEKLALREWNRRIGVNLGGAFLMSKHAVPHLKAGLVGLTHALAVSLGPEIRVNCVSPGWIAHRPVSRRDHSQHPVGRVGRDEDIAELVAYLLSDAAGFITGQNFVVDGGMTRKMIYV